MFDMAAVNMKEWHVVVLEGCKRLFDKVYYKVEEARAAEKEKRVEYADRMAAGEVRVVREWY
jgi:hypothetical protein